MKDKDNASGTLLILAGILECAAAVLTYINRLIPAPISLTFLAAGICMFGGGYFLLHTQKKHSQQAAKTEEQPAAQPAGDDEKQKAE